MAHLFISLLGSFQITLDGRPVTDFGTDKTRGLLAYLVVEAGRGHRRDALAGLLWPDSPQARARHSLRQAISHLRQTLGDPGQPSPFLLSSRETLQFNPDSDYRLDVADFAALAEANRTHRHRSLERCLPCTERMAQMAELYGGVFLGGFFLADSNAFEEWATLQREFLQRQVMEALACLVDYHERRGDVRQAIRLAQQQVGIEPWREEAHRQLMRLLALDGQRSAALAQYQACQQALVVELGVEPTAETTALYQRIRAHEPTPASPARQHNLPPSPTPFVGREGELAELADLLADPDCRLLTLTGPGGIGKTRLALQVAASHAGLFAQGITHVRLAAVASAELLAPTIAEALCFRFHNRGEPESQLLDLLREKELLLVLDNLEHLLAGSKFVARILHHCPHVTLLVTSQERLNLREEWVYEVRGLTHPSHPEPTDLEAFSAVTLFVQTARRGHRAFRLSAENSPSVVRICQMVEGLPLAVELAAAWIPARTCAEIADEIERNLDALVSQLRNVPTRHRSLRAAFEHTWNLLAEPQRTALRRLSIFRGGFQRDAATRVAKAPPETLAALVEKSLLRRDASGRYDLHRLIQQYAVEKLEAVPQELQATEDLHLDHYTSFLSERETWFRGHRQAEALETIAAEIENVRWAWRLALDHRKAEAIGRSLASLGAFYAIRSWHQEGARAFEQAAERLLASPPGNSQPDQPAIVAAGLLAWQGHFVYRLGRYDEARDLLARSLELLAPHDAPRELAFSLYTLAQILCFGHNDYREAERLFRESLARCQALGDAYGSAQALDGLGDVAVRQGQPEEARLHYEEGLALRRGVGDRWGVSVSLGSLGGLAGRLGNYDRARTYFEESLAIGRGLDNPRGVAASLHNLSTVAYLQGDYVHSKQLRQQTLTICREIGYRWGVASALKSLGDVAGRLGEHQEARRYLLESLALAEELGDRRSLAYTLNSLGTATQATGDRAESERHFQRALQAAMEIQEPALALDVLGSLARSAAKTGDPAKALQLAAFVRHHPASEQQTRTQMESLRAELAALLDEDDAAGAEARGQALDLDRVVAGIISTEP